MANTPAAGPTNLDPQAAIAKHAQTTQANAGADQATIQRIEQAIAHSPMGWLQAQFGEVNSRAASEQGAINGKVSEHKDLVASNQKAAPKDAGAPPRLGAATRPAVNQPAASGSKGGTSPAVNKGVGPEHKVQKAPSGAVARGAPRGAVATPGGLAGSLAGAQNDGQLDQMLNDYRPRGSEATQMIGRIGQMKGIADGFNGQLDVYVAQGGAVEQGIASVSNFFGVGKDTSAVWANNPYRKVGGTLGGIMTGLSALKNVTGLVGSICGKLGLVLTVVGLLGMIFPPIGAAVSGIARILNVVGVICDAISLVLSGILTGLNGVVLAKQIATGASAEEKAATADLMISEANSAASGLINMAMTFGPKFMKGLTTGSRGVLGSLIRRFKAVVGRVSLKLSGNVKNFANRMVRKMGFGGARMGRVDGAWKDVSKLAKAKEWVGNSRVGKAFNSAPKVIDSVQDKLMSRYGNTGWAKKLDRVGAWSGAAANKFDMEAKVGNWVEKQGTRLGNLGQDTAFAKGMSKAADAAESQTREAAMRLAQRDAMDLERRRWDNHLAERQAKQQGAGGPSLSADGQAKFVDKRVGNVEQKFDKDFAHSEKNRQGTSWQADREAKRVDKISDKYWDNPDKAKGGDFRDGYMNSLHDSRERRWRLEAQHGAADKQREELRKLGEKATAEQTAKLTRLDKQLAGLDRARQTNLSREAEFGKISGYKQQEVHNWKDVTDNVQGAVDPVLEMLHLKDQEAAWRRAERHRLSSTLKWNGGDAARNAAGRGGSGTYAEIQTEAQRAQMADFAAFVALGRPQPTTAQTVRSMLASINSTPSTQTRTPVAPPPPVNATPTSTTASTVSSMVSPQAQPGTQATVTAQPTTNAPVATPVAPPAPVAAEPQAAEPEGAEEALPYWPDLIPELDKAMTDFGYMRKVATEFKKAQIEGKQKAVDTLAVYGRYQEYAKARQAAAAQNQTGAQSTQTDAGQNASQAGQSQSQAGQGAAKQGEARSAAGNRAAVDLPEPETRGFWDRILGAVKRWAKNKAAQIFGWIQEKVASVILQGLCGVSMGDLREYAGALRRQQMAAQTVAGGAAQRSGQVQQTSIKLGSDATKEAQSAADSIGECDRNIVEADTFMSDVTSFEAQLSQEKAHAQAFIGQVRAAFHVEQERKKQEEAQRAAEEAAAAQRAAAVAEGGENSVGAVAPTNDAPPMDPHLDMDNDGMPDSAEAEAAKAQIVAAADYVKDTASRMEVQVDGRAQDYTNQLKLALTNRTGKDTDGNDLRGPAADGAKHIVDEFRQMVVTTRTSLDEVRGAQVDPSSARRIADQVITVAESLDSNYDQTLQQLDDLFDRSYAGIRDGRRDLKTRILDGGSVVGFVNRHASHANDVAYENASPVLNAVADTALAPIKPSAAPAMPDDMKQYMDVSSSSW